MTASSQNLNLGQKPIPYWVAHPRIAGHEIAPDTVTNAPTVQAGDMRTKINALAKNASNTLAFY